MFLVGSDKRLRFLGVVLESVAVVFLWSGSWVEGLVFLILGDGESATAVQDRFVGRGMMMNDGLKGIFGNGRRMDWLGL